MKRQIRRGVFETNSSSVHSITMCSGNEYQKWENGEVYYWQECDKFGTKDQIIEEMKSKKWSDGTSVYEYTDEQWNDQDVIDDIFSEDRVQTYEKFFDNYEFETFEDTYTTSGGEEVVAFGYYGHD